MGGKSMKKATIILMSICLAVGLTATSLIAAIVGTTGAVVEVTPPSSVMTGMVESSTQVIAFQEQDQLQLTSNIDVDISSPGTYFPASALTPSTIPADTLISGSYFLHFDAAAFTGFVVVDGSVTFECPIIGVSILTQQIDNSDAALGASGTVYPTGIEPLRGLTFEEYVMLSADMKTLSMHLEIDENIDPNLDQFRVVTLCEPVCGDGILDEGEECDDGNNDNGDGCSADCTLEPVCGDGVLDPGEQCDDGNNDDGDGCSADCTLEVGGDGCTPGYWKQSQHFDSWTAPYTPDTMFSTVFENAFPGMTLLDVLSQGGGKLNALGRHTVAALLSAASQDVSYDLAESQVIMMFNDEYPDGDYKGLKNIFEYFNELGCPID
jgi:cysteine-rich repeat protein